MTTGINPVQAATSKKTNTKRYNHQEPSGFARLLHHYASGEIAAPPTPREDGFERPKQAPIPPKKMHNIEVKSMQRQVVQVNQELLQLLLISQH